MSTRGRQSVRSADSKARKRSRSIDSKRSTNQYSKVKQADEVEMADMATMDDLAVGSISMPVGKSGKQELRPHEIYEKTEYIPNTALRLLEIPMNSSLTFQKLLWFHASYDMIYGVMMLYGFYHRIMVLYPEIVMYVVSILAIFWVPLEVFRLNFGYRGNINETFPELIAFLIFTTFFTLPLSVLPFLLGQFGFWPHERVCTIINLSFVVCELVISIFVMRRFMQTQSAAFYLRTAPLIDKSFQKKYSNSSEVQSVREIQLGMQTFDAKYDSMAPFKESDRMLNHLK